MPKRRRYVFTDKREVPAGKMASILGVLSALSLYLSVFGTFTNAGQIKIKYAVGLLLGTVFAITGLVLGIKGRLQKESFYLFSWIGIVLNGVTLLLICILMYLGYALG